MTDYFITLGLFWTIWLLAPIVIDGFGAAANLISVLMIRRARQHREQISSDQVLEYPPMVSIILPIYNVGDTLEVCLRSIAEQDYPHTHMEVLLIDNGSTDNSFDVFARMQSELDLRMAWHSIINQGKAWALNAGIHVANGRYIFNIDSDVVLAPDAIRRVVERMEAEPDLGAVTGSVQVLPAPTDASPLQHILAECEFLEYLASFHVGRQFQSLLDNLYTMAGAFSVFRREVLVQSFLYTQETVTEDTDLTFELHERFPDYRVGAVSEAVAYTHPVESLGKLYAQRVRWQRGQLEVSARHIKLMRRSIWQLRGFSPLRVLLVDHTASFPRLAWTFLLPILLAYGYPASLVILAMVTLYAFYVLIDLAWVIAVWIEVDSAVRRRLLRMWWLAPLLPAYRMLVFWFRMSGFLYALAEPGEWRVQDPISQIRDGLQDLSRRVTGSSQAVLTDAEESIEQRSG